MCPPHAIINDLSVPGGASGMDALQRWRRVTADRKD
jgi:hypothetical protein